MPQPLRLLLPFPPSVNRYWRRVGNRTLISKRGREFRQEVVAILWEQKVTPREGPLLVQVDAYPPDRRRRDLDNLLKALLDALEHGGAYEDDSQIVELVICKRAVVKGGRVGVLIEASQDPEG